MKHTILILMLGLSLFATACTSSGTSATPAPETIPVVSVDDTILAEGRLEPIRYAEISFSVAGLISDVPVQEGDHVKKGETLVQLGDETDMNFTAAQLELASVNQAMNDLQNTGGIDLAQIVIDLKDAKEKYVRAENYLHYLQTSQRIPQTDTRVILVQTWKGYRYEYKIKNFKGPAPKDWIIEAENDLALKKAHLDELQRAYDRMKDGVDSEQLALLETRLEAARAKVAAFSVLAPFDGVVADLHAKIGDSINMGEIAVTVADFTDWVIKTTDVTELDVVNVRENQPAIVQFDAFPDVEFKGVVLSIGQTYSENQGDIVYEVTILLTETHPALRWGMTASVTFVNDD